MNANERADKIMLAIFGEHKHKDGKPCKDQELIAAQITEAERIRKMEADK